MAKNTRKHSEAVRKKSTDGSSYLCSPIDFGSNHRHRTSEVSAERAEKEGRKSGGL